MTTPTTDVEKLASTIDALILRRLNAARLHDAKVYVTAIGDHIRTYVADALKSRDEEILTLKSEVAVLKNRPTMHYEGVWRADATYTEQALVTDHGAPWVAIAAPQKGARPGDSSQASRAWQLAGKTK